MSAVVNRVGQVYGRLTVVRRAGSDKNKKALWLCQCECGSSVVAIGQSLQTGNTQSCGCYRREHAGKVGEARTHGLTHTPEYYAWKAARQRTTNPNDKDWGNYGGRGIAMCDSWRRSGGFEKFFAHIGPKPGPSYSLDRVDNDGHYEPGNVRWADKATQSRNQRKRAA